MRGRTVIAIAHRLSTVSNFDRIVVLQGGRVVQDGAPADLLRDQGTYRDLMRRQSGLHVVNARVAAYFSRRESGKSRTRMRRVRKLSLILAVVTMAHGALAAPDSPACATFDCFVKALWPDAQARGVSAGGVRRGARERIARPASPRAGEFGAGIRAAGRDLYRRAHRGEHDRVRAKTRRAPVRTRSTASSSNTASSARSW